MKAYKMNIDPDAAERLAKEVGEEEAAAVLERVRKKVEYQDSMPNHPRKKSPDWFFGHAAHECRMKSRAEKRDVRLSKDYLESIKASKEAHEKGYRPDSDTLANQIEEILAKSETLDGPKITYDDFQRTMRFLDSVEEK
jgi:hypothetical protein